MLTLNLLFIILETGNHSDNGSEPQSGKHGLLNYFLDRGFFALGGQMSIVLLFIKYV